MAGGVKSIVGEYRLTPIDAENTKVQLPPYPNPYPNPNLNPNSNPNPKPEPEP